MSLWIQQRSMELWMADPNEGQGGPVLLGFCQSMTLCIKLCTFLMHLRSISEALLCTLCHGTTSLFPFLSLSVPRPISVTFQLHLPLSTYLHLPLLQL